MSESVHRGILVAVDGSPESMAAVAWATRDAALRHTVLTLVHVVAPVASGGAWPEMPVPGNFLQWQDEEARRVLQEARDVVADNSQAGAPAMVHSVVLHGPVVSTLVDRSKDADMMVVGSQGRGAFSRALLGSVSTGLVHHAHCPVAVIRDGAPAAGPQAPVLVGVDGSPASLAATEIGFEEAAQRGVELVALHAWHDVSMIELPGLNVEEMEQQAHQALAERLAGFQERFPEVPVRRVVVRDQPARQLVEHGKDAQLVVVGSHGRGGFAGMLLGSVSTAVVHAVATPVVVARRP